MKNLVSYEISIAYVKYFLCHYGYVYLPERERKLTRLLK